MKLNIKSIVDGIDKVQYTKEGDAGIDLRAADEYIIKPGERVLIKTGIIMAIPNGYWGNIRDRSGLAYKHGLHTLAGVIDETYRGEIGVLIVNLGKHEYKITKNDRIAQIIIMSYITTEIEYVDKLDETIRGDNGFGSTGV